MPDSRPFAAIGGRLAVRLLRWAGVLAGALVVAAVLALAGWVAMERGVDPGAVGDDGEVDAVVALVGDPGRLAPAEAVAQRTGATLVISQRLPTDLKGAQEVGWFSYEHESTAGKCVADRDGEYLVSRKWVEEIASEIGFSVVINEPVNALGDGLILLRV